MPIIPVLWVQRHVDPWVSPTTQPSIFDKVPAIERLPLKNKWVDSEE